MVRWSGLNPHTKGDPLDQTPLTGEQLFLRYAYPCAEDKLHTGKIDQTHFARLTTLAIGNGQPDHRLLKYCFPHAFHSLRDFAEKKGCKDPRGIWAFKIVAEYWRHNHGHEGDCRVLYSIVEEVLGKGARVLPSGSDKIISAPNPYGLQLAVGDTVRLHRLVIIEQE